MSESAANPMPATGSASKTRTEVFISAASGDLRSVRELVKQGLLTMGCHPVEQANFAPDYRTVRQMLKTRIGECDAVIHIVGRRYGAEPDPASLPKGEARRSYTQMEAEIARQLKKKLYVFLCPPDFPYDEEPDQESAEKYALQEEYRKRVAEQESLHTAVRDREDIALKVRELQLELEKLKGTITRHHARTFALLTGLAVILAALAAGVWWWAARTPQATARIVAEKVGEQLRYDRQRTRDNLAGEIKEQAAKRTAPLDRTKDWKKILEIEKERDQQLADLDKFLNGIEQTTERGEASESYLTAIKLLQEPGKGISEALAFLEAKSSQRASLIEAQKSRRDREEKDLRRLLQEELLAASLMEKQLRFHDAEEKYRKIVEDAGAWAKPRNDLAWILIHRGRVIEPKEGNVKLKEAVEICRGTLALNTKAKAPQDWATTQNILGAALDELGMRSTGEEGRHLLEEAVGVFRSSLEVRSKADQPQDWATSQNNLGIALAELGTRSTDEQRRRQLEEAIAAYRSTLEVHTRADLPQAWAATQYNLGAALYELGRRSEGEQSRRQLEEAITAFRGALEINTKTKAPQDWAATQNNLGLALYGLGRQSEGEQGRRQLEEAVAAYRSTLEVHTRADLPQAWAATQNNLGNALNALGTLSEGEQARRQLEDAIAAYRSALEIRTRADLAQDWAATQNNLGFALRELGTRSEGEQARRQLVESIAAFRSALEVRTKADLPQDWAGTQDDLGEALRELGERSEGEQRRRQFEEAVAAFRSALEVITKADLPQGWAKTQNNLGNALDDLGEKSEGEEGRRQVEEAVSSFRSALEVYTKADQPQDWATAKNNLASSLWALGDLEEGVGKLTAEQNSIELRREVEAEQPSDQSRLEIANALGGIAFNLILNRRFLQAQSACEEAQRFADKIGDGIEKEDRDDLIFIQGNLAHALLFQGRYDEAFAIYRKHWNQPMMKKTFGASTLEDFTEFKKAGLTHPNLARAKAALAKLRP